MRRAGREKKRGREKEEKDVAGRKIKKGKRDRWECTRRCWRECFTIKK